MWGYHILMKSKITSEFSIIDFCLRREDCAYVALSNDEASKDHRTFIGYLQLKPNESFRNIGSTNQSLTGIEIVKQPLEQFIAVNNLGSVFCSGSGDTHNEFIGDESYGPKTLGPLRGLRTLGQTTFVVGMNRQVFKRVGQIWERFDNGITQPKETTGFETVNGQNEEDFYAAGWDGEIWHFQKNEWKQMNSPTNRILTDVCLAGNDIFICGQAGTLLKKKGPNFEIVDLGNFKIDIWSLAWFQGRLYLSTFAGIFKYDEEVLSFIDLGQTLGVQTFYKLKTLGQTLWSYGAKDLVVFDGSTWRRSI